jgi:hypothetical protein
VCAVAGFEDDDIGSNRLITRAAYDAADARAFQHRPGASTEQRARAEECDAHRGLLRDIFNPFRSIPVEPDWLTPTVRELALAAYEARQLPAGTPENDRLKVLADALEEAGCKDERILGHLRDSGPHVRGCWAVDTLLGPS